MKEKIINTFKNINWISVIISLGIVAICILLDQVSKYIIENSSDNNFNDEILKKAIGTAYDYLDELDNGSEKKMGTTMTLLKFHSNGVTIAHIGDSRVYQIRPGEGIVFVTRDHSLVNDLLKTGELTPEEAINYKHKNVITRAMQPCLERRYNADIYNTDDIQAGDYFYLCSDGMLEETSDENIVNIFSLNISCFSSGVISSSSSIAPTNIEGLQVG